MVGQDIFVVSRRCRASDYDQMAALWSRINRELAPVGMEELFEQYIATTISGGLVHLLEVFSEAKKKDWPLAPVVERVQRNGVEWLCLSDAVCEGVSSCARLSWRALWRLRSPSALLLHSMNWCK